MHTITLNIHDSIYETLMNLLGKLPKEKFTIEEEPDFPAISASEAKEKVERVLDGIEKGEGIPLDDAFKRILNAG